MKTLQIILLALTAFSGCAKKADSASAKMSDTLKTTTMAASDSVTYLALGDSYTIGQSVPLSQSYPYQLTNLLNSSAGLNVKAPTIIATTGWTTDDLISAISQSGIHNKTYDFVTLLIGVNDQYQHLSEDNYRTKFAEVLSTAIGFARGDTSRVFVLSIPDWGVTPFAAGQDSIIGPKIDEFNAINKTISLQAGVHYLDITPISREAANNPALVADDGLHPSGVMYKMWISLLEPMVALRLKK